MLRTQAVQKWAEICKANFNQPKVYGTWRNFGYERADFELLGP